MLKLGWNHVDLLTEDMEATRHFYDDILGMEIAREDRVDIERPPYATTTPSERRQWFE
jgi:catechol 2,3-dioxygenase-like lactoylglutathione lyase family enzyme